MNSKRAIALPTVFIECADVACMYSLTKAEETVAVVAIRMAGVNK